MKASRYPSLTALALLAIALFVMACPPRGQPRPEEPPVPEPTAQPQEAEEAGTTDEAEAAEAPDEVVVEMTADRFQPDQVTVQVGHTVRWRNTSDRVHTVTADPDRAADPENVELPEGAQTFDSGDIAPGDEYTREFNQAGTYRYVCVPHEAMGMVGTVTVEEREEAE